MQFSNKLKAEIRKEAKRQSLNQVAAGAGVDRAMLSRFLSGDRPNITINNVDRLVEYLGLELRPAKKRETAGKQSRKKQATGSRPRKKPKR